MTQETANMFAAEYEYLLADGLDCDDAVTQIALAHGFSCEEVEEALGIDATN